jgi:F-box-like
MRDSRAPTTISNFPVELLQQIFNHCTAFEDPLLVHYAYPAWIAVTHVCSYWRAVSLNYSSLWTLISTNTMGKSWIKAFMERSNPSLIDLTLDFNPISYRTKHFLNVDEAITLFTGCMRLRSLKVIGRTSVVCELLGELHTALPIRSLSLSVIDTNMRPVVLPDNMLGGQAPIPNVCFFKIGGSIIAPHWLLRGITHFTSHQLISLQSLLDILHQMPSLHSFILEGHVLNVKCPTASRNLQIPMPNLKYFTVNVKQRSPTIFDLLLRRLILPDGAKKSVRLHKSLWRDPTIWSPFMLGIPSYIRKVIEAANGLRHAQLSGGSLEGSFRLWTGDLGYEEAEFSFEISWRAQGTGNGPLHPVIDLAALCDLLGVERVRTLTLHTSSQDCIGPGNPFRQVLLRKLPGAEVVE